MHGTVPTTLGSFSIQQQVGIGVLGPVYSAFDASSGHSVAVKVFKLDVPPEQVLVFATALNRLTSSCPPRAALARTQQVLYVDGVAYLVQDFVNGEPLDRVELAGGDHQLACRWLIELARALDAAASMGTCHGLLHPRDVLVQGERVVVTGLGVAQALADIDYRLPVRRPYTAPERQSGEAWDARADQFSLAVLAAEWLAGRRLSTTGPEAAHILRDVPGARDPDQLCSWFARAFDPDPGRRFASSTEFAVGVAELCGFNRDLFAESNAGVGTTEDLRTTTFAHLRPLAIELPVVQPPRELTPEPALDPEPTLAADVPIVEEPDDKSPLDAVLDRHGDRGELSDDLSLPFEADEPERSLLDEPEHHSIPLSGGMLGLGGESGGAQREAAQYAQSHLDPGAGRAWKDRRRGRMPIAASLALLAMGLTVGGLMGYVAGFRDGETATRDAASATPARQSAAKLPESRPEPVNADKPLNADKPTSPDESAHVWSESPVAVERTPPKPKPPPVAPVPEPSAKAAPKPTPAPENRSRTARMEPPRRSTEDEPEISAGRLLIRSTPANATVTIDGQPRGTTPLVLRDLPFGSYQISVQHDGYLNDTRLVHLSRSQPSTTTTFELTPVSRQTSLDTRVRAGGAGRQ